MRSSIAWIGAVIIFWGLYSSTLLDQGLADEPAGPIGSPKSSQGAGTKGATGGKAVSPVVEGQPSPSAAAGEVQGRSGMHDHRAHPGAVTPSLPTPGVGRHPLLLPNDPAPTLNLASVASAIRYDHKSFSTVLTTPIKLPLSQPVTISIGYVPSGVAGYGRYCQERVTQPYTPATGNTFLCALPEGDGQPRHLHLDITLSEPKPGGGCVFLQRSCRDRSRPAV